MQNCRPKESSLKSKRGKSKWQMSSVKGRFLQRNSKLLMKKEIVLQKKEKWTSKDRNKPMKREKFLSKKIVLERKKRRKKSVNGSKRKNRGR